MPDVEIYLTGNQIGTYQGLSMSGNSNGVKVTLNGVQTLGTSSDTFRVVIRQVAPGETEFTNGQFVDIYPYPDTTPPGPLLYSSLNPQHDQFQGRASSDGHQIFTQPAKIVFDVEGLTNGTVRYGPGLNPPRTQKLDFDAFPSVPPNPVCFVAGTLIETASGPLPIEVLRPGDLVRTTDHGLQPLRLLARRTVPGIGNYAPIGFAPGAIGNSRNCQRRFKTGPLGRSNSGPPGWRACQSARGLHVTGARSGLRRWVY